MKNFLKFLSVFLVGIFLVLFLLPFFLSTPLGKEALIRLTALQTSKKISIQDLKIRWSSGIEITDLSYCDAEENTAIIIQKIKTKDSLLSFIKNGFRFQEILVASPDLFFTIGTSSDTTNFSLFPFAMSEKLVIKEGKLTLYQKDKPALFLKGIEIVSDLPKTLDRLHLHFVSSTEYQNKKGMIDLYTSARFNKEDFWPTLQCEILGKAVTFPTPFVDLLLKQQGFSIPINSLGGYLHLDTKIAKTPNQFSIDLYVLSDRLRADIHTKDQMIQGNWSLDLRGMGMPEKLHLASLEVGTLNGKIQKLQIPLKDHYLSLKNAAFEVTLQTQFSPLHSLHWDLEEFTCKTLDLADSLQFSWKSETFIDQTQGLFEGRGEVFSLFDPSNARINTKATLKMPLSGVEQTATFSLDGPLLAALFKAESDLMPSSGILKTFLTEKTHLEYSSSVAIPFLAFKEGIAKVDSPSLIATIPLSLSFNPFTLSLREQATYEYTVSPKAADYILPRFSTYLSILEPLKVEGECDPFQATFNNKWELSSSFRTQFQVVSGKVQESRTKTLISLEQTKGSLTIDSSLKEIDTKFSSSFPYENLQSAIQISCSLKNFPLLESPSLETAKGRLEADMKDFPTVFLASSLEKKNGLSDVIGSTFSGHITWLHSNAKELSFEFHSTDFAMSASFDCNGSLESKRPFKIQSTISPEKSRNLCKIWNFNSKLFLDKPVDISIEIEKLILPRWNYWNATTPDLDKMSGKGEIKISPLSLPYFSVNQGTEILPSKITFSKKSSEPFLFDFRSAIQTADAKSGNISLQASFFAKPQPPFIDTSHTLLTQITGQNLPSEFLDSLSTFSSQTSFPYFSILGDTANFSLSANIEQGSGPFTFRFKSPYAKLDFQGVFMKNTLLAKEDVKATIAWNPLLEKILVGSQYQITSSNPIELRIPAKSTIVVLDKNFLTQTSIPSIKLSLGKLSLLNKSSLQNLSSLFRLKNNRLNFWFAPFEAKCSQGVLQIARTEVLVEDQFQVCLWGNLQLQKNYVHFHLGLTQQSLQKALGIHGLPPSFVLDIPVKGSYYKVAVDTKLAAAKIAALIAHSQSDQFGSFKPFVDIFHTMMNDQSSIPPPRPPYPWNTPIAATKHIPERTLKKRKKDKELFEYALPLEIFSFEQEPAIKP